MSESDSSHGHIAAEKVTFILVVVAAITRAIVAVKILVTTVVKVKMEVAEVGIKLYNCTCSEL